MTPYDFLDKYIWMLWIIGSIALLLLCISLYFLFKAFHEGKEVNLFWGLIKIGARISGNISQESFDKAISRDFPTRANENIKQEPYSNDQQKIKEIRNELPEQSILTLAFQSKIKELLLSCALEINGGFAGIGYPGKRLYDKYTLEQLVDRLPHLIDAARAGRLEKTILDFFDITEPNIYGISIPQDEFDTAIQNGVFIVNRLEKILRFLKARPINSGVPDSYTEEILSQY